jgi:hypothetical protein
MKTGSGVPFESACSEAKPDTKGTPGVPVFMPSELDTYKQLAQVNRHAGFKRF